MLDAGIIVMTAFISPFRVDRKIVRELVTDGDFIEIYCQADLEVCEERDPKGLYKKARAGEIKNFTGIDDPYEAPTNPEIHLKTDQMTVEEEVSMIIDYLKSNGVIKKQYLTRATDAA